MSRTTKLHMLSGALLLFLVTAARAEALQMATPAQNWRSIETQHFLVHYPRDLAEWTRSTAGKLESIYEAVSGLVGYSTTQRVTVLVDDPSNVSNGYAYPGPLIFLFPTPPEPHSTIAEHRGWGELLAVHEFAHIAHLSRPSRNPFNNFVRSILPVQLGPIVQAPRWVLEGYATYVEGKLTGSGRPYGLWRPTLLRQLALQGALPGYQGLNASEGFFAGSMPYIAGSAFLEWLVEKEGEESLVNLWRRMTARTQRSFTSAFNGVYGASPSELYGRFAAEVTARAFRVEEIVEAAGRQEGALFQRFGWYLGDPALSPNGQQLVVPVRSRLAPTRIVILSTSDDTITDAARRAAERARARDPEDVPAVSRAPRPHRQIAALESPAGKPYDSPRFMRDGARILLTRLEARSDGTVRPDLFEWRWRQNSVRRITHGAAVRQPDPAPSGLWAAAAQCLDGSCSIVRIAMADGAVQVLARGNPDRSFYRPRVSPDGNSIVASMNEGGRWILVRIDAMSGEMTPLPIDDNASRFDAEFLPDGSGIVTVSTTGGVFNLEHIDPAARTSRRVTNVAGAAFSPAISPRGDTAYFLSLRANGYDIRRIALSTTAPIPLLNDADLTPVVTAAARPAAPFAVTPVGADKPYGLGPQRPFWLPHGGGDASGGYAGVVLALSDPVGRLGTSVVASAGGANSWRGASLTSEWRGWPVQVGLDVHVSGRRFDLADAAAPPSLELRYTGAQLSAHKNFGAINRGLSLSAGAWGGTVGDGVQPALTRTLAFARMAASAAHQNGPSGVAGSFAVNFEIGETDGESWNRVGFGAGASLRSSMADLRASVNAGFADASAAPVEQYLVGGDFSPHLDRRSSSNFVTAPVIRRALPSGNEFLKVRGELSGMFPATLYGEWIWPGGVGNATEYFATVGLSQSLQSASLPLIAAPAVSGEAGAGLVVAGPHAKRLAAYLMVLIRP